MKPLRPTRRRLASATLVIALVAGWQAAASSTTVTLDPTTTSIGLTVFAMGLFALPGEFHQFSGLLLLDPANPGRCHVTLDVAVASLRMADASRTRTALGPKLLDAAHFPNLHYVGTCGADAANGELTMHGVTHKLNLLATRDGVTVSAHGSLHRGDYGVGGLPGLIGRRVDMRFTVTLPPGVASLLQPG